MPLPLRNWPRSFLQCNFFFPKSSWRDPVSARREGNSTPTIRNDRSCCRLFRRSHRLQRNSLYLDRGKSHPGSCPPRIARNISANCRRGVSRMVLRGLFPGEDGLENEISRRRGAQGGTYHVKQENQQQQRGRAEPGEGMEVTEDQPG